MNVNWLVESHYMGEDVVELIAEVKRQGYNLVEMSDKNYWDTPWNDFFDKDDCVVYHGGLGMASEIRRNTSWIPGIYSSLKNYECSCYYPYFGDRLLNNTYIMMPYGELLRNKEFLYDHLGIDDAIFIRPNSGNKPFTGKLVYKENFEKDVDIFSCSGSIDMHSLCVVAEPRNVEYEWRFLVVDNEIVTGSRYLPNRQEVKTALINPTKEDLYDVKARHFAEQAIYNNLYQPDRAWMLDICKTKQDYYVLETGCFSCAGLYAMNLEKVVRKISEIACNDWEMVYNLE